MGASAKRGNSHFADYSARGLRPHPLKPFSPSRLGRGYRGWAVIEASTGLTEITGVKYSLFEPRLLAQALATKIFGVNTLFVAPNYVSPGTFRGTLNVTSPCLRYTIGDIISHIK